MNGKIVFYTVQIRKKEKAIMFIWEFGDVPECNKSYSSYLGLSLFAPPQPSDLAGN